MYAKTDFVKLRKKNVIFVHELIEEIRRETFS